METWSIIYELSPLAGAFALGFAFLKSAWINKRAPGNEVMSKIAGNIREGAMAFLSAARYKQLAIFVLIVAGLLAFANSGKADSNRDRTVLCRRCNLLWLSGLCWHARRYSRQC